jgi:hypothetical protein
MSFLRETKRRKVFQVAAVYLVVSWRIIQVVDVVDEPLNPPDWLDTVVNVLLAIEHPIAMVLAWASDLTLEGMVRDSGSVSQSSGRTIEHLLIGLIVIAMGWFVYRVEFDSAGTAATNNGDALPKSIAVLPFAYLSFGSENDFFNSTHSR